MSNKVTGIVMGSVVPPLTSTFMTMAQRYFGMRAAECGQQRRYRHADSVQEPRRGRRRSHSQRRRRLSPVRPRAPRADDRGRFRHRHDLRRHLGEGGVSGRRHHARACRFPPMRCFSARRGCRASTCKKPCEVIGRTTVSAIESGLYYGYVGLVDGLVRRMRDELGQNAVCIATGGLASVIAPEVDLIEHVDPDLTLQGLRMVWERNRPRERGRPRDDQRRVLPRNRSLSLPQERRPPDQNRRTLFRARLQLGRAGHSVQDRLPGHRSPISFRYYAKGVRRRPVQIDFCENDILDAFDAWRRAVGVRLPGVEPTAEEAQARRRKRSLPEHLDRVCERVTARRAGMTPPPPEFDAVLDADYNGSGGVSRSAGAAARRDSRAGSRRGSKNWIV